MGIIDFLFLRPIHQIIQTVVNICWMKESECNGINVKYTTKSVRYLMKPYKKGNFDTLAIPWHPLKTMLSHPFSCFSSLEWRSLQRTALKLVLVYRQSNNLQCNLTSMWPLHVCIIASEYTFSFVFRFYPQWIPQKQKF